MLDRADRTYTYLGSLSVEPLTLKRFITKLLRSMT